MTTTNGMSEKIHQGRNIKRFREMLGIKQEALAIELGEDWNQKKVSLLESKETIDEVLLEQVAAVLQVPKEAIKSFSEEAAITIISSTLHDQSGSINHSPIFNFNPIDKIVELYEALVKSEKEKIQILQNIINERK